MEGILILRKFASAAILEARMGTDAGFSKSAHRAVFNYTPREGYLYVRSRAISSRCNDNFDAFPAEEIEKSYLTFIGKPVFVNHHNDDHRRARGVIIDAALHKDVNPDGSPDTWVELLHEVDAIKFPKLAKAILAGEVDRTSMGCDVQFSKCSACNNVASSPLEYCEHIPSKKGKKLYRVDPRTGQRTAQLVFEICSGLSFFENSLLVEAPADPTAFFLGSVEAGPGLDHLTASIPTKTATLQDSTPPSPSMRRTASVQQSKVWDMIHDAARTGDDLFDWDFVVEGFVKKHAITKEDMDAWHRQNPSHPKNIVHLYHYAVDHGFFKDKELPKPSDENIVQNGHQWYEGMHHVGNALASVAHHSLGLNEHGHHDPELARNRTFGALAVYSEGTDVPMNYHQASISTRIGKGIYSGNPGLSKSDQATEFGKVKDTNKDSPTKGQMVPGKPKSTKDQENKVNEIYLPTTNHFNRVVKAPKTNNYGHLGYHGGDEPGTHYNLDQIASGQNGRVVVDRHALSAAIGRRIDGVDFSHAGLSEYKKSVNNPLAHQEGEYGKDANKHYNYVADAYRVAAHHLSQHYGTTIAPHQVQAVAWAVQRHLNENGHLTHPKVSDSRSSWKRSDEDTWQGIVHAKHGWMHNLDNASQFSVPTGFANRPNDRNRNNWESHIDRNPDIGEPINKAFPEGGRGHWGKKLAYGETKSPQDVDTLRSENCTVCGNSSAWDGTQCQVCGYVAPPRPFGDPNTDIAGQQDIRKQVLDGTEADPNDPNQQLGQQLGNPDEVEDQEDATAAGENTQMQQLVCDNCGTGVTPTPPETEGEPPYPAENDVCPVCKKGQLLGSQDEEPEMDSVDAEEGQEGDAPGGSDRNDLEADDGDEDENKDDKGTESDDDNSDDEDSPFDKNKKQKKASSWRPVWWTS